MMIFGPCFILCFVKLSARNVFRNFCLDHVSYDDTMDQRSDWIRLKLTTVTGFEIQNYTY